MKSEMIFLFSVPKKFTSQTLYLKGGRVGVSGTGHSKNGRTAKFGRISGFFELK
jgi:hypothetical protein